MTWITWRLQRTEFVLLGLLCAGLTAMLLATHGEVARLAGACTEFQCRIELGSGPPQIEQTSRLYSIVLQGLGWFNFLPLIAALLLALPILSELDNGTYRLAWTQSITRRNWAGHRLAALGLGGVAFALLFGVTFNWWAAPQDKFIGRLGQDSFDLRGIAPVGHTLFAISLTLAIGVLLRRPGVTIALASFAYVAVRLPFMIFVLPHLRTPVTAQVKPGDAPHPQDWILSNYWVDGAGHRLPELQSLCPLNPAIRSAGNSDAVRECITRNGLVQFVTFHPSSRFWSFQLIETGIFVAAAIALLGFAAWYLLRRVE
jgi:hypothetical protein